MHSAQCPCADKSNRERFLLVKDSLGWKVFRTLFMEMSRTLPAKASLGGIRKSTGNWTWSVALERQFIGEGLIRTGEMLVFFVQRGFCAVSSEGTVFCCGEDEPSRQETVGNVGLFLERLWVPTSGDTICVSFGHTW